MYQTINDAYFLNTYLTGCILTRLWDSLFQDFESWRVRDRLIVWHTLVTSGATINQCDYKSCYDDSVKVSQLFTQRFKCVCKGKGDSMMKI